MFGINLGDHEAESDLFWPASQMALPLPAASRIISSYNNIRSHSYTNLIEEIYIQSQKKKKQCIISSVDLNTQHM